MQKLVVSISLLFAFISSGCGQSSPPPPAVPVDASTGNFDAYQPGLGEIMTLQQMRHTKLWLAGQAANWDLAAYEIKELGEGFDDVVRFHPTHEESPVALKDAIPRMVTVPLEELKAVVEKKDAKGFGAAYDNLTRACNECHKATNFGFNVVQRPAANPYPDQAFAPPK
jgi:hypothetical protein